MRLIALLACEKVISDAAGIPSLINVMTAANINVSAVVGELPEDAISPADWWIYTLLEGSEDEIGKRFVLKSTVVWPNGKQFASIESQFAVGFQTLPS